MKKILILLIAAIFIQSCSQRVYQGKHRYVPINIGTTANDGTGDPLRTMAQKTNAGFAEVADSLGNIYTEAQTRNVISDTIIARIAAGATLSDYAWLKTDTVYGQAEQIVTQTQLSNFEGGGSGTSWQELEMIIGSTTGAPASGDTTFTQSGFAGKHIELYRDGLRQYQNSTATNTREGFRFNNFTGALTVLPSFASGEVVTMTIDEPISQTNLSVEGQESALADSLLAFWNLDETSGIIANDAVGSLDGTATGVTVNQTGQFGKAFLFGGAGNVSMGASATLRPQTHSISFWVNTTQASTAGLVSNWVWATEYYGYAVSMLAGGTVEYNIRFTDDTYVTATSTATINNGSWHNIICTWDGATARLYIDGVAAGTDTEGSTKTIQYASGCAFRLGDRNEGDLPLTGTIDAVGIWTQVLNTADRVELQTKTHPF